MGKYKAEPRYNVVSTRPKNETAGRLDQIAKESRISMAKLLSRIADEYVEAHK